MSTTQVELSTLDKANLAAASSKATASMVLGIIGLVIFGLAALVSLPLALSANKTYKRYPEHAHLYGKGKAVAGLVMSWIVIGIWALIWVLILGALAVAVS